MNKLRALLALLLLVVLVAGCGGGKKVKTESGEAVIGKDKVEVTDESGKTTIGTNVDLPKSYPKDMVPLLKPVAISASSESKEGEMVVICASKAEVKEATQYYSGVLADATDKHMASGSDFGIVGGIKASKAITIGITAGDEKDGVKSVISITIEEAGGVEGQSVTESSNGSVEPAGSGSDSFSGNADKPANNVDLPNAYPRDLVPLYQVERIDFILEENEDEFQVYYLSQAPLKEATEYYKNVLADANDKSTAIGPDAAMLGGTMKGKNILLEICRDDADTGKSQIRILIMNE